MTDEDRLAEAIADLGLTLEQVGPEAAVEFALGEGGQIALYMGDEERICRTIDEALQVLESWAEDHNADPSRPGAIVEFVDALSSQLGEVERSRRAEAFFDLDLGPLLARFGLEELDPDEFDPSGTLDDGSLLCLVEDGNGACWSVFLDEDDEVGYDIAEPGD